jgi:hypothetical protein
MTLRVKDLRLKVEGIPRALYAATSSIPAASTFARSPFYISGQDVVHFLKIIVKLARPIDEGCILKGPESYELKLRVVLDICQIKD